MTPKITSRFIVSVLGTYACALVFTHRAGLSVAIVSMVKSSNETHHNLKGSCIIGNNSHKENDNQNNGQFDWSETLQGVILGGAFYAYLITPTVAGRVTERFGAKWLLAFTVTVPGIITALTPLAAEHHVGFVIAIRVIIGACNGCVYCSMFALYANWIPKQERSSAVSTLAFGGYMGIVIMFPLAGYLCKYGFANGWGSVFYVTALLHIPWIIGWCIFVTDTPAQCKRISREELKYIQENCGGSGLNKSVSAPWCSILTSRVVWGAIIGRVSGDFANFLLINKLPSYLDNVFGIPINQNGLFNSMVNFATAIAMFIGGRLSDYIISKKLISLTRLRKNFEIIALLGPALCIGLIPVAGCDATIVIALITVGMFAYGFMTGGDWSIIPEYAPDFSGTILGLTNTLALSMGFISPLVAGVFLDQNPRDANNWNIVFYITIGISIFGALMFELFASAEPQSWGVIPDDLKILEENCDANDEPTHEISKNS